jgi:PhoD-like phosphatase
MSDALVLGPLLRFVDETTATVWVEVAARGRVAVLADGRAFETHTFTVHGHHYALVEVDGLRPGSSNPYQVRVDDRVVWPPADSPYPGSRIRTLAPGGRHRVLFGSCRTSVPHDAEHNRTHGIDVLRTYALGLRGADEAEWPDLALFLGDQVYADETSRSMQEFIAARRDIARPPYGELLDYEEYAHLYRLAWTDEANRWLLSTLPSAMIFDDHDVRDDWNTSRAWRDTMVHSAWWRTRVVSALASYWVYQHLGNLSPAERAADTLWADVRRVGRDGDAGPLLDELAERSDQDPEYTRWSYHRDVGGSRLMMLDTRCARMLDEGDRRMLDEGEMGWFESLATGGVDHLLVGSSLPFMLPMGLHHVEAWNEAVAAGAWGARAARWAEKVRQGVDLEHWAAFQKSFQRVARHVVAVAHGELGDPPATVTFLSGDVHHSYLAEARLGRRHRRGLRARRGPRGGARVLQLVCSPIRNPLPRAIRFAAATMAYGLAWPTGKIGARSAKVPNPPFRWSLTDGPWFDNAIATLDLDGRRARVTWRTADFRGGAAEPSLVTIRSATLS